MFQIISLKVKHNFFYTGAYYTIVNVLQNLTKMIFLFPSNKCLADLRRARCSILVLILKVSFLQKSE